MNSGMCYRTFSTPGQRACGLRHSIRRMDQLSNGCCNGSKHSEGKQGGGAPPGAACTPVGPWAFGPYAQWPPGHTSFESEDYNFVTLAHSGAEGHCHGRTQFALLLGGAFLAVIPPSLLTSMLDVVAISMQSAPEEISHASSQRAAC